MPDIRYICLSDLHLGEEDSLFTCLTGQNTDPSRPSPVMIALVQCLRSLVAANRDRQKPTLILNGDILELALAHDAPAAMVFQRFMELIQPADNELFEQVIFIPGNHDHHLWELARETQYLHHISHHLAPGDPLPDPWHATNLFMAAGRQPVVSNFLTRLVGQCCNVHPIDVRVAYPNLGLVSEGGRRCAIFHHGHFAESIYQLMSRLKNLIFPDRRAPLHVWDIEAENFAWIDFFWSALGRSGEVGKDVEIIYEKMQDKTQFGKLLQTLVVSARQRYGFWPSLAASLLKFLLLRNMTGTERMKEDVLLSDNARKGLRNYMEGALREQILLECKETLPDEMTFIFGHTHKPFQQPMDFRGYPKRIAVYNSGGWVVEGEEPLPLHGGAMILMDAGLHPVSVRMFNERDNPSDYAVKVEDAADGVTTPFLLSIKALIDPARAPWKTFSETTALDVQERIGYLQQRVHK